jgi:hypothetical protein
VTEPERILLLLGTAGDFTDQEIFFSLPFLSFFFLAVLGFELRDLLYHLKHAPCLEFFFFFWYWDLN